MVNKKTLTSSWYSKENCHKLILDWIINLLRHLHRSKSKEQKQAKQKKRHTYTLGSFSFGSRDNCVIFNYVPWCQIKSFFCPKKVDKILVPIVNFFGNYIIYIYIIRQTNSQFSTRVNPVDSTLDKLKAVTA